MPLEVADVAWWVPEEEAITCGVVIAIPNSCYTSPEYKRWTGASNGERGRKVSCQAAELEMGYIVPASFANSYFTALFHSRLSFFLRVLGHVLEDSGLEPFTEYCKLHLSDMKYGKAMERPGQCLSRTRNCSTSSNSIP